MKKVFTIILVCALIATLGVTALASTDDVVLNFTEDSGDYVRSVDLSPKGREDDLTCALYYTYGWLYADADGSFQYELDTENKDVKAARKHDRQLTESIRVRYSDADGAIRWRTLRFLLQTRETEEELPEDSYALLNDGESAVAEGRFFDEAEEDDRQEPELLAICGGWGEYLPTEEPGVLIFTLNNYAQEVQRLAENETGRSTMEFRLRDQDGKTRTQALIVTVLGKNDVPVVQSFAPTLDLGPHATVSGSALAGSRLGDGWAHQHSFTWGDETSTVGVITKNPDGTYAYAVDRNAGVILDMVEGDSVTEIFTYTYRDKDGSTATGRLTVTVGWADVTPQVQDHEYTLVEDSGADDDDDVYLVEIADVLSGSVPGNGPLTSHSFAWAGTESAVYGTVARNADGSFSYRLQNASAQVQALYPAAGAREVFEYTYTDADGSVATGSVVITIEGKNDAPTVEDMADSITDGGTGNGAVLVGSKPGNGPASRHSFAWGSQTAVYGTMTKNANGSYTYVAGGAKARELEAGETASDVFSFTYTDVTGTAATGRLTITVTGVNDRPVGGSGTLDVYLDDPTVTGDIFDIATLGDGSAAEHTIRWVGSPDFGDVTAAGGSFEYALDMDNADVQALAEGNTLTDTIGFTLQDSNGDSGPGAFVVTIKWADLTPALKQDGDVTEEFTEDGAKTNATGNIYGNIILGNGTPAQHSITWNTRNINVLPGGVYFAGNADGSYSVTIDSTQNNIRRLKTGEDLTLSVGYTCEDADGSAVEGALAITIHGKTNDVPAVMPFTISAVEDEGTYAFAGDVLYGALMGDGVHTFAWDDGPGTYADAYGTMVLSADGGYSYTFNNSSRAVQKLRQGDTITQTYGFTYQDEDGDADPDCRVLTVNIRGATDYPGPDSIRGVLTISGSSVSAANTVFTGDLFSLGVSPGDGDPVVEVLDTDGWQRTSIGGVTAYEWKNSRIGNLNPYFDTITVDANGNISVTVTPAGVAAITDPNGALFTVSCGVTADGSYANVVLWILITVPQD